MSLRHPTDRTVHPIHRAIRAPLLYLPEYILHEPLRSLRGWWQARRLPGYRAARRAWWADLRRDRTINRARRWGQALVLAAELAPEIGWLHAHFLHTPASVTRYTAILRDLPWSGSAHAKDIWLSPDWEIREKLASAAWLVTCSRYGHERLARLSPEPGRVTLAYHGLDFARFAAPPPAAPDGPDGSDANHPVTLLSVGRAVPKKGYDDLLTALAALPAGLAWRLIHVGGGPLGDRLKRQAATLGLADRIAWRGAQPQDEVLRLYRSADLFILASRIADDGDRDGLPNVLMEAQSQRLPVLATAVAAVPELIVDGESGLLAPPGEPAILARSLARLIGDPALRRRLGEAGFARVRRDFDQAQGLALLAGRFGLPGAEDRVRPCA